MIAFKRIAWATAVVLAVSLTLGCSDQSTPTTPKKEEPTRPAPAEPEPVPEPEPAPVDPPDAAAPNAMVGRADYQVFCASCHGESGAGDGPVAATLDPKPARHSDGNLMNALSDEYLFKVIKEGGQSVGKSAMMAPWGGSVSDAQIRNLVAFIRTLADPPYTP